MTLRNQLEHFCCLNISRKDPWRKRQLKMVLLMYSAAVLQFVLGVFVMILNIIFIYDGMNSKWYGQVDDLNEATNVDEDGNIIPTGAELDTGFYGTFLNGKVD